MWDQTILLLVLIIIQMIGARNFKWNAKMAPKNSIENPWKSANFVYLLQLKKDERPRKQVLSSLELVKIFTLKSRPQRPDDEVKQSWTCLPNDFSTSVQAHCGGVSFMVRHHGTVQGVPQSCQTQQRHHLRASVQVDSLLWTDWHWHGFWGHPVPCQCYLLTTEKKIHIVTHSGAWIRTGQVLWTPRISCGDRCQHGQPQPLFRHFVLLNIDAGRT